MFITPAYAQAAGAAGTSDFLVSVVPFILIFVIMYFLIIRPQRQQMKKHAEMIASVRRGDTIVTSGGLVAKITKVVDDTKVQAEIAEGVKVTIMRKAIAELNAKGEPAGDAS